MDNAGLKYIQAVDCHICLTGKVKHVRHYHRSYFSRYQKLGNVLINGIQFLVRCDIVDRVPFVFCWPVMWPIYLKQFLFMCIGDECLDFVFHSYT